MSMVTELQTKKLSYALRVTWIERRPGIIED